MVILRPKEHGPLTFSVMVQEPFEENALIQIRRFIKESRYRNDMSDYECSNLDITDPKEAAYNIELYPLNHVAINHND